VITAIAIAAVVVVAAMVYLGTRPERFRIERSALISAPAEVVFPLINDFHQWARWSPWEKLDPKMEKTFGGPTAQPGSTYAWSGNSKAGSGRITLMESKPGELVSIKLEFFKPLPATNQGSFTLAPSGGATRVTWSMEGKNTLMGKVMSPFMDGIVGKEFERGLASMDTEAQAEMRRPRQGAQSA
jgi:hypothetical protein